MCHILNRFIKSAPQVSGVYRMLDKSGDVLYIGKAKNLKKRLVNYTFIEKLPVRLQNMVKQISSIEITTTRTESEALLLESNLIKSLKPRYNILLRDDKSFPYIMITGDEFPRIVRHRGKRKDSNSYYGPFASAYDASSAISLIQRAFLLRPCSNGVFSSRNRPCLEYQIKRCSAPCVDKISNEEYLWLVKQAEKFLSGKSHIVQKELQHYMEESSLRMDFEKAAIYRDRIKALIAVQAKQGINAKTMKNADVIAIASEGGDVCIQVFFIRGGNMISNKAFFPSQAEGYNDCTIVEMFLGTFYQNNPPPPEIILSNDISDTSIMEEALSSLSTKKVKIFIPKRGEKKAIVETAISNAEESLRRNINESQTQKKLLQKTAELFEIKDKITRIEVFDNSHTSGTYSVGAMIVSGDDGFIKSAYRKFNVDSGAKSTGGDDYLMLEQVLMRRYSRIKNENSIKPNLILIDGGAGHLSVAKRVFEKLDVNDIVFVCIAKGVDRNAGREDFYMTGREKFKLPNDDAVLHFLQRLRDEAHRFAIFSHRAKREKSAHKSILDEISGVGAKRKKALLNHFGSLNGIKEATLEELSKVDGINKKTAHEILNYLIVLDL